ncbi:MAG TPA: hypothetical protein ENH62_17095 [Marinobacter sp.]|uniref:Uncharacterized protein n=1 Tax=marine sediment metagenome TaxID=412755 RepID=A0A0F9SD88_9ZZZZ|nr:hypothetical protein [Marinobacter sp.]
MTEEGKDKEGGAGEGDDERMVPLNVVTSIRADEQAKRTALEAQIEELEAEKDVLSRADEPAYTGKYDEEDRAEVKSIAQGLLEDQLGPLVSVIETLVGNTQNSALKSKLEGVEGLPAEMTDALLGKVEDYRAEAAKQGRTITHQEALGYLLVEDLPGVVKSISETSEESRKTALDKKRAAAMVAAGGGLPVGVPTELDKDWHKSLPDGVDPADFALARVLEASGVELPGPS